MTSDIVKHTQIFINNQFVNSVSGKTFPTYNPATEEVIANVQEADAADVDLAGIFFFFLLKIFFVISISLMISKNSFK